MPKHQWIPEDEAAKKLDYKPRTLRKLVKSGTLDISYTTLRGRNYRYDERSIDRLLDKKAVIVY